MLPYGRQVDGEHVADALAGVTKRVMERCSSRDVCVAYRAGPDGIDVLGEAPRQRGATHVGVAVLEPPEVAALRGGRRPAAEGQRGRPGVREAQGELAEQSSLPRRQSKRGDERDGVTEDLHAAARLGHFDGDELPGPETTDFRLVDDGDSPAGYDSR